MAVEGFVDKNLPEISSFPTCETFPQQADIKPVIIRKF
jgi:hypothetical protein